MVRLDLDLPGLEVHVSDQEPVELSGPHAGVQEDKELKLVSERTGEIPYTLM